MQATCRYFLQSAVSPGTTRQCSDLVISGISYMLLLCFNIAQKWYIYDFLDMQTDIDKNAPVY